MQDKPEWHLKEAIAYYREQGAPRDQQALIALLKEVQAEKGGKIPKKSLEKLAESYAIKKSLLKAVIRTVPGLRHEDAPHTLEVCGHKACLKNGAGRLCAFLKDAYGAEDGGVSQGGEFSLRVAGCLKKCGKGPVIRWDGESYTHADEALIRRLLQQAGAEK